MTITYIISAITTAVIIPFFAPLLLDALAGIYIEIRNKTSNKPTWVVGVSFKDIILTNAASLGPCFIVSKTWKFIVLKEQGSNPGYIRIKKRDLMKAITIESKPIYK